MKSYVAFLVLALSPGLALATEFKEEKAANECNVTNPVQRNPILVILNGVTSGERIKLSQEEKCFMLCFLQKVKFLNENAEIYNSPALINITLNSIPGIAKYSDVIIAQVFQIKRSTKGFEDKCQKAFVTYHQCSQNLFMLAIAESLQQKTDVRDKIISSFENGQSVDQELSKQIKIFSLLFQLLISSYANGIENQTQSP